MTAGNGPIGFEARRADFVYLASLEAPIFDVLGTGGRLYAAIYTGLAKHGAKLADIRVEGATANPADISVGCYLLNVSSLVQYRLDRVEVRSSPRALGEIWLQELVEDAMRIARQASETVRVATHTLSLGVHGFLMKGSVSAWLDGYVPRVPDGPPSFRPNGVSFACEWPGVESESSVLFERSLLIADGAFLRMTAVYPGGTSEREAFRSAAGFFATAAARLNLELRWSW